MSRRVGADIQLTLARVEFEAILCKLYRQLLCSELYHLNPGIPHQAIVHVHHLFRGKVREEGGHASPRVGVDRFREDQLRYVCKEDR